MKKTIIAVLATAAVVGGVVYYTNTRKALNQDDVITLRQIVDDANKLPGCPREVIFGEWGCAVVDADCNRKEGSLLISEARERCNLPANSTQGLTEDQFNCAASACATSALEVNQNQDSLKVDR